MGGLGALGDIILHVHEEWKFDLPTRYVMGEVTHAHVRDDLYQLKKKKKKKKNALWIVACWTV